MKFPLFFRRKSLVLPTLSGWIFILAISGLLFVTLFRNMATFLIVNEPVGSEHLVIEAWMNKDELDQGLKYFRANDYDKVLLVGGPISNDFYGIHSNYAERAAAYLIQQGLPESSTVAVPAPFVREKRTFINAVAVRDWFMQQEIPLRSIDIFSSGVHTRRSRDLYQQAFGSQVSVGIIASQPKNFDPATWWKSSGTGKLVAVEFANWVLTKCCLDMEPPTPMGAE